jgi:LDH2 family malate/lactate/ureidoglycolate dehydrogenase
LKREGKSLPPQAAVDAEGNPTTDPNQAVALLPFGAHKGYGLSLINELFGGLIGGSLPTLRSRWADDAEKHTCAFFFQVIHPDALNGADFAAGRSQAENLAAVIGDVLGHGNDRAMLPGQLEAEWSRRCEQAGGLLFSLAEVQAFQELSAECGLSPWDPAALAQVEIG